MLSGAMTTIRSPAESEARRPAARRAYDHVKERLLAGAYEEGELLSEGTIAQELGISRTPVREALLQLQSEHLLTLYPKRGALVTPVSGREVAELFESRLLLERHCLRAALPPGPGLLAALEAELARQRELLAHADFAGFVTADREFHRLWVAAAGNRILLDLYDDRDRRAAAARAVRRARADPRRAARRGRRSRRRRAHAAPRRDAAAQHGLSRAGRGRGALVVLVGCDVVLDLDVAAVEREADAVVRESLGVGERVGRDRPVGDLRGAGDPDVVFLAVDHPNHPAAILFRGAADFRQR
jgi:DNA-binding GntR family transcriptional regulator